MSENPELATARAAVDELTQRLRRAEGEAVVGGVGRPGQGAEGHGANSFAGQQKSPAFVAGPSGGAAHGAGLDHKM